MALTRALAANNEKIENTEVTVTSALAFDVTAILPAILDGTGATVANDFSVTVYANAAGSVFVHDQYGRRRACVRSGEAWNFNAIGDGTALNTRWLASLNDEKFSVKAAQVQAVGGGAAIAFGATTPGAIATPGSVNTFLKFTLVDGSVAYVPAWK